MTPREIIAEAWAITKREKLIRRWGYYHSFFELLLTLKLLSYQAYFLYEYFAGHGGGGFFDVEIIIYNSMPHWFFWTFIIVLCLLFTIEFFFPHLAEGAVIGLIAKSKMGEEVKGGLVLALYNFFPIFAIHELFVLGSLSMTITLASVVLRYVTSGIAWPTVAGLFALWLFCNIMRFFFSFAQEAVVIDRRGIFDGMGRSFKLIISYLSHIMFLLLLLFVISIRILLNTLIVLVIPALVAGISFLLTMIFSPLLTWIIASVITIVLVLIASYFFGYLHVFKQAVWTITYLELRKNKDLDVIG